MAKVQPGDLDRIVQATEHLPNSPTLVNEQITLITGIPATGDDVHASWSALAVPVVVVTAELLVLTWLLLFLVVTDAVDARGAEWPSPTRRRSDAAGLGEPAVLLVLALPVGAIVGWLLSVVLTHVLLRAGTPVPLPALGWGAPPSPSGAAQPRSSSAGAVRSCDQWSNNGVAPDGVRMIAVGSSMPWS